MGCNCGKPKNSPTSQSQTVNEQKRLTRQEAVEKFRAERQQRLLAQRRNVQKAYANREAVDQVLDALR